MYGKNFEIHILNDCYDAIQFGTGKEDLVLLPGLGDGMTTVRGKAMMGRNHSVRTGGALLPCPAGQNV